MVIELKDLKTNIKVEEGIINALSGITFSIDEGETLGLIGESGCGKSITARSILRILPDNSSIEGSIRFTRKNGDVVDLDSVNPKSDVMREIRGGEISMIFQEPMTSFSPVYKVGEQIRESVVLHRESDPEKSREIVLELMEKVGISEPELRYDSYPGQLSGGLCQRSMIALAIACHPKLIIADEPTTALDVTVQAQILRLIKTIQEETGSSVLFITHNLGVIAQVADRVAVMYLGKIVETASVIDLFKSPLHPYTKGLMESIPLKTNAKDDRLKVIEGTVPIPLNLQPCCGFHPRCPLKIEGKCDVMVPELVEREKGHYVACFAL